MIRVGTRLDATDKAILISFAFNSFKCLLIFSIFAFPCFSFAQTIPVSNQLMQDFLRINQLKGEIDSNISLNLKPVSFNVLSNQSESLGISFTSKNVFNGSDQLIFKVLPFTIDQQYNSSNSYGWNDGLMIPAKGYQQYISAGFFLKAGPLTIQAQPEFVYAENPDYLSGNDRTASDRYLNFISLNGYGADLPTHYERENFSTLALGQSSVRLNLGPVSLGLSNENLWWGPGRRTALLMSNNARGFRHVTLNTIRPIITPVGSLEGQIIGGRLENSGSPIDLTKNQDWRYLSGMVFNYQPKWIPGLSLGLTRVFQIYNTDIKGFNDYIPLFQPFEKKRTEEDSKRRDQLTSVFAKFIFREANAEIYTEFARNDHSFNLRDFIQEPQHSRAYLFGFQKLVSLPTDQDKLLFSAEIIHLSQPINRILRNAGTWYVHEINQGYTNFGEIIGAGTGPGGNLQSFEFSWINGFKRLGIQVERYERNKDYYQMVIDPSDSYNRQWVDFSAALLGNWVYKNLLLSGKLSGIQSFNYMWQTGISDLPQKNTFNLNARLGIHYYFKK